MFFFSAVCFSPVHCERSSTTKSLVQFSLFCLLWLFCLIFQQKARQEIHHASVAKFPGGEMALLPLFWVSFHTQKKTCLFRPTGFTFLLYHAAIPVDSVCSSSRGHSVCLVQSLLFPFQQGPSNAVWKHIINVNATEQVVVWRLDQPARLGGATTPPIQFAEL